MAILDLFKEGGFDQGKHRGTYERHQEAFFRKLMYVILSILAANLYTSNFASHLTLIRRLVSLLSEAGLQGVGKTTVSAKLALYLKKQGKSCMLIAGDVYRPAAIDQLVILGEQVDVPVYAAGTDVKPAEIARQGLQEAKKKNVDVIDKAMMDELKEVKRVLNPTEVLLVVDAMTGQEAAGLVTTFNLEIGITGAILTKLDGDSRGGAVMSRRYQGSQLLVGRQKRMEDFEPSILTAWLDVFLGWEMSRSFAEKAQEVMGQEDAEDLQKKIMSANLDFNDFLKQTQSSCSDGYHVPRYWNDSWHGKGYSCTTREAEKSLKIMESMIEVMTPGESTRCSTFSNACTYEDLDEAPPGTVRRKPRSEPRKQFADSGSARPQLLVSGQELKL
ncbi:hypothetical protein HAX54_001123 [Datura stramonium]|uniref:SRP54-type proteins GTP-binding domain-containing protein n=1 Tax=Datura stramonium TaxID=4076 RepID=A0ABS8RVN2_DATST|nr:hypothetical protein [Datura stramonium]